ncbi:response regulator transcription factor [Ihubacter massiliensis]|uniref:Stage 0 sporulation protein A homolog n=1 Tax=Hominibacterium faecale TaxID=2839743 RepID=A0A9J6QVI2_9FIRM|nr:MULTISPECIES: response regulator transcription factor [Eubacteriales Family XIII. Incertae Sedis]MCI7304529.1 response regulator transcription factor [Clostridia bacterium]MDE8731938.1 response regulator transcription factor [Eubacteriales bacterium DFI.9.88]MDY3013181.1 response regulator transcription factor [Clostridiales Family XIII bacterium]MCO7122530.1 response regulator transcription factor [Ihubacter massiliensis]MCU7376806.1 response regulator transcription factor [Hominibacterium
MKKILLIEDDQALNAGLTYDLEAENYRVYSAYSLAEGMELLDKNQVDLILLDVNLPDGEGYDLCRGVKAQMGTPVIFLTARDLDEDELKGFDCGADDYITKPFNMEVLHKRIQVALRKHAPKAQNTRYSDGYLMIDFGKMVLKKEGRILSLTPTEFKILNLLIASKDRVLTKQLLLEKIWDSEGNFVDEHVVAVNINRLRKKIEDENHSYIKTLYGMGYQWTGGGF